MISAKPERVIHGTSDYAPLSYSFGSARKAQAFIYTSREALNKSTLDFSAPVTGKRGFQMTNKINRLDD